MKRNMGTLDRIARLAAVAVILYLSYQRIVTGPLAIILLVLAVIFAVTSFVGFCPLYTLFGFNSGRQKAGS